MHHSYNKKIVIAAVALLLPSVACANTGVPMLVVMMPVFVISLLPIIAIEAWYLSRKLALNAIKSATTVTISNLVSTFLGIPLVWAVLLLVQMETVDAVRGLDSTLKDIVVVIWQTPWIDSNEETIGSMLLTAYTVLLIPFFFMSWWSEYYVSKMLLPDHPAMVLKAKVRNANLITYALMALWPVCLLAFGYVASL